MKCGQRTLTLASLAVGLLATGILCLAVVTDFWLFTSEPIRKVLDYNETLEYTDTESRRELEESNTTTDGPATISVEIRAHSGLWRMCMSFDGIRAPTCSVINYLYQDWDRVTDADTTWSILRAIRKSAPVIVFSLILMITAFTLATLGNTKRDSKTISGAVMYAFAALILAVGVILYISAVNDEVAHRREPNPDGSVFQYHYEWGFFFASAAFVCAMMAAVTNVTLYLNRYPTVDDMAKIIPGLDKKKGYDFSKITTDEDIESKTCSENPTLVL